MSSLHCLCCKTVLLVQTDRYPGIQFFSALTVSAVTLWNREGS